jgi:hypothetical protein
MPRNSLSGSKMNFVVSTATRAVVSDVSVESDVEDCTLSSPWRQETLREMIKILQVTILSVSIGLQVH